MKGKVILVQGGQYGSEGKGGIAAHLCLEHNIDYAVRTGAVNAGHTVYYNGKPFKMQQLPTSWVNRNTQLVIGAGAYVYPEILTREDDWVSEMMGGDLRSRLWIDSRVGLHTTAHTERSTAVNRHHRIGATGKGCSEAIIDKISNRGRGYANFFRSSDYRAKKYAGCEIDTERLLNEAYDSGDSILLEATQGDLLDLFLGPYPYTTHKATSPGNWLAEVGLSPKMNIEICLVVRTMPIRVAGNSGPLPQETDWVSLINSWDESRAALGMGCLCDPESVWEFKRACDMVASRWDMLHPNMIDDQRLREEMSYQISEFHLEALKMMPDKAVTEISKVLEMTTVTQKVRRIAQLDIPTMKGSIRRNRPDYLAVTFLNYIFPELWGETTIHEEAKRWLFKLEKDLDVRVKYVSTGPLPHHTFDVAV